MKHRNFKQKFTYIFVNYEFIIKVTNDILFCTLVILFPYFKLVQYNFSKTSILWETES